MFENIFVSYSGTTASVEIFILLWGSFIFGVFFWWLIKPKKYHEDIAKISSVKEKKLLQKIEEEIGDDLKLIEGIWPAVEKVLQKYGVKSYNDIIVEGVTGLEEILKQAGGRFEKYNPATWPDQARLARSKKWRELEEYQEILSKPSRK